MRRLAVAELEPEAPVVRLLAPEAGQDADEARGTGPPSPRPASPRRRASARAARAPTASRSPSEPCEPRAGLPVEPRPEAERLEHRGGEVLGERHLRAGRQRLAENLEPVLRVDPPRPRLRDRRSPVERQPGRVGEQVPHRRPRRPGRLVQVERPLLRGDEARERRHRLRHRRPAELARGRRVRTAFRGQKRHRRRRGPRASRRRAPEPPSRVDTRSMNRQLISSGSPYEPVMGFSRAVRVGQHVFVAGTAPVMPEGEELPSDAYGQTKRCLEIIVAALREAGAEPEHVVRTRIFATSAAIFEEVARAHGAVFGETKPACTLRRHAADRPALARRDRGGGARPVSEGVHPAEHHGPELRRRRERARPLLRQGRPVHARRRGGVHAPRRGDVRPRPAHRHRARGRRRPRARGPDQPGADAVGARDHDAGLPDGRRRRARADAGCART